MAIVLLNPSMMSRNLLFPAWPLPPIFSLIQEDGGIHREEMYRVFNMGLGMVLVCDPSSTDAVTRLVPDSLVAGQVVEDHGAGPVSL